VREYRTAVFDNRRWKDFKHRDDDIFVCTPAKCGTTWMQTIVANLLWPDGNLPGPVMTISPWIEALFIPADEMHGMLEAQTFRRAMKSHTPADGIPWNPHAKYVFVGRDGRDVFMSFVNHVERMKLIDVLNAKAVEDGVPPLPKYTGDIHGFFEDWVANDSILFDVVASYWAKRHEPNLLLVHYNDLKVDLSREMHGVASHLDVRVSDAQWPAVVERCTFEGLRAREDMVGNFDRGFEGGLQGFLFKGTNGRWRDVLTPEELATYERRASERLPTAAARWLAGGPPPRTRLTRGRASDPPLRKRVRPLRVTRVRCRPTP